MVCKIAFYLVLGSSVSDMIFLFAKESLGSKNYIQLSYSIFLKKSQNPSQLTANRKTLPFSFDFFKQKKNFINNFLNFFFHFQVKIRIEKRKSFSVH